MEFHCGGESDARSRKHNTLSLQGYLDFIESHKQLNLTIGSLNQIISMHGFKRLHQTEKKVLIDAVNSIELMDLTRSTLNDVAHTSSSAFISTEESIEDLTALNWRECSVASIETFNSVNYDSVRSANKSVSASKKKQPKLMTEAVVKESTSKRKKLKPSGDGAAGGDLGSSCSMVSAGPIA